MERRISTNCVMTFLKSSVRPAIHASIFIFICQTKCKHCAVCVRKYICAVDTLVAIEAAYCTLSCLKLLQCLHYNWVYICTIHMYVYLYMYIYTNNIRLYYLCTFKRMYKHTYLCICNRGEEVCTTYTYVHMYVYRYSGVKPRSLVRYSRA